MFLYATGFYGLPIGSWNSSPLQSYLSQLGWQMSGGEIESGGRYGNCMSLTGDWARPQNYGWWKRDFSASETVIIGAAFKGTTVASGYNYHAIFSFFDTSTQQLMITVDAERRLVVRRGNETWMGQSTESLAVNTWYYIEAKVTFHQNGLGQVVVRIDENEVINLQNVTTTISSNNYANRVEFRSESGGGTRYYDDIYILNGVDSGVVGMPNNDFLGDSRVDYIVPDGAGTTTQLTVQGAASNYLAVDDSTSNTDTDYVYSSTVGQKDTYAMSSPSVLNAIIYGMIINTHAKKDNPGSRTGVSVVRTNSSEVDGNDMNLGTGYSYFTDIYEYNPVTDGQWTPEEIEALEIGIKVKA